MPPGQSFKLHSQRFKQGVVIQPSFVGQAIVGKSALTTGRLLRGVYKQWITGEVGARPIGRTVGPGGP